MPTFSQLFNAACVIIVIAVALGAWRYGGGRRSRDGALKGGDYSSWTDSSSGSHGHDGGSGGHGS